MMTDMTREQYLHLCILTRRLSIMINGGMSLVRDLVVLAGETPAPYAGALQEIKQRVEHGETLSEAITVHPALFPPIYRMMVHVGEVGGILDETLTVLATLLEKDWRYLVRTGGQPICFTDFAAVNDIDELSPLQHTLFNLLFCRSFGLLCNSGVPVGLGMSLLADYLPTAQRTWWVANIERMCRERVEVPFLPPFARSLVTLGEETGALDHQLLNAADAFQQELECRFWETIRE